VGVVTDIRQAEESKIFLPPPRIEAGLLVFQLVP
jgi:hypothetical protein